MYKKDICNLLKMYICHLFIKNIIDNKDNYLYNYYISLAQLFQLAA